MDDRRFDDLVRSLSIRLPRRGLGPLAGGLLAAFGASDAGGERRKSQRRNADRHPDSPEPRAENRPGAAKKKRTCIKAGGACTPVSSSKGEKKPKPCCPGLTCSNGVCASSGGSGCPAGQKLCDGSCVPESACCPACSAGQACANGTCTDCPAGQKPCGDACVLQTDCCPACAAGQSCVDGTCTGGGSAACGVGLKECDGVCVPVDTCCPFCATNQACNAGRCESLPCDAAALDNCLAGIAQSSASARPCAAQCADSGSDACGECVADWMLGELGVDACYTAHCDFGDPVAPTAEDRWVRRPTTCESRWGTGKCCKQNLDWCVQEAEADLTPNALKAAGKKAAKILAGCLLGAACPAAIAIFARTVVSSGGSAGAKYVAALSYCNYFYGCGIDLGGEATCTRGNICCRRGQVSSSDTPAICCWPGNQEGDFCGNPDGIVTSNGSRCCGYSVNSPNSHLICMNRQCVDCASGAIGRADGDQCCRPQCTGKCGGDNGCGGTCPTTCAAPQVCNTTTNLCCPPNCTGKCGGPNGCGGTCPNTCPTGQRCADNVCVPGTCTPNCGGFCHDVPNGCGGSCRTCPAGQFCGGTICITCTASHCAGRCGGVDPCGNPCPNSCPAGQVCNTATNYCCVPNCTGKCGGSNGCGGTCPNTCQSGQVCNPATNTCCWPECWNGQKCSGSDGCGGTCPNACPAGSVCRADNGFCCSIAYACSGKCGGSNACGTTCPNTCTPPQVCNPATNTCCTPNCTNRCGQSNGCGGTCPPCGGCDGNPYMERCPGGFCCLIGLCPTDNVPLCMET